jgi:hypothetical protein
MTAPSDETLPMWVVYDHPADYPDAYVARQHVVGTSGNTPTNRVMVGELESIRTRLATQGLVQLYRHQDDDPAIVETWL